MGINPCCKMPLQKGVKVLAIIDILLSIVEIILAGIGIVVIVSGIGLISLIHDTYTKTQKSPIPAYTFVIVLFAIFVIITIVKILLSVRLLAGAKTREVRFCKIWLIIAIIIGILTLGTIIYVGGDSFEVMAMLSSGFLYRLYMIWVVYAFVQELKLETSTDGVGTREKNGVVYNL